MVERWCIVPQDFALADSDPILGVVFLGVIGTKHQCRPATADELQQMCLEPAIKEPTDFIFANQRFCELMVEVMGA